MSKTVALNIISLIKIREIIVTESGTTNYNNHHSVINNTVDDLKLVWLLVEDAIFEKQFGQECEAKTLDLCTCEIAKMATRIYLHKYQICIRGNYNKILPDSNPEIDESDEINLDTNNKNI